MTAKAAPPLGSKALPSSKDTSEDLEKPEWDDGLIGHSVPRSTQDSANAKPRIMEPEKGRTVGVY